ncbi:PQQ-binding-like beta-propeller repeat protein [Krasilnikovia sp. MM14-A1004]|uniref:outer membrane protein assembly factor BamB family protein n=1 Tax=Krasilnikovia sp. MM14-A1004 TaxID=3373541 RepID=UPI00399CB9E1
MRHRIGAGLSATALLAATLGLSGQPAQAAAAGGWPEVGYDPGHSYYNPNESLINASTLKKVKMRWQVTPTPPSDDCPFAPVQVGPVVAGGLTLTQDYKGLVARDSVTGQQVWKTDDYIPDRTAHNVLVAGNTVIVTATERECGIEGGESDGQIEAYDLMSGAHLWHAEDDTDANTVTVIDGVVVVGGDNYATDPLVTAYRLSDGVGVWSDGTNSDGARTLVSTIPINGGVLVNHYGHEIVLKDVHTGQERSSWPMTWQPLAATPTGDIVFVGDSSDWTLKAVRASDQRVLWSMDRVSNRVATDGRRLYMGIGSNLEAYDSATGRLLWSVKLGGRTGQPLRAGGLIYVSVAGKPVAIRNASNGAKVRASTALASVKHVEAVGGGHVYATIGTSWIGVYAP